MEERTIELTAKGHSVGESLEMSIIAEKGASIGSSMNIELSFQDAKMDPPLDLVISSVRGFDSPEITVPGDDMSVSTRAINAVPIGKEGPSIFKLIIKGEVYGATLAISETDLDLLPPKLEISLMEGQLTLSGSGKTPILLKGEMPGNTKFKGDVHLSLLDGSENTVGETSVKHFSFKGSRTLEMNLDIQPPSPGTYSLDVRIKGKGRSSHKVLKDSLIYTGPSIEEHPDQIDKVEMPDAEKLRLVSVKFQPKDISPGESCQISLEVERKEGISETLHCGVMIGKHRIKELVIPQQESSIREKISIPDSFRSGNVTAIITIAHKDETIFREVLPRALTITGSSQLKIRVAAPSDLKEEDQDQMGNYLFPGEGVRAIRSLGDHEVRYLTTGRHLYLKEGNVILGHGWDEAKTDEAFNILLGLELSEAFLEPSLHRKLRKEIEGAGNVGILSIVGGNDKRSDPWSLDLKKDEKITDGTMSGSVMAHCSGGDGSIFSSIRSKELHKDRIPSIVSDIKDLFSIEEGNSDFKDRYENIIRGFRSQKSIPGKRSTLLAHQISLGGARKALDKLVDENERIQGAMELLFFLILASLIRIEALTHWSGPAVGSWDDLRIERQRTLKKEISGLFDMLDGVASISTSLRKRMEAYRTNIQVRRDLSCLSRIKVIAGESGLSGKGGETWKGKMIVDLGKGSKGMEISTSIRLPGLSWNLISPNSQRDGQLFILPAEVIDNTGRLELELEVSTPSATTSVQNALIYLTPSSTRMEVED